MQVRGRAGAGESICAADRRHVDDGRERQERRRGSQGRRRGADRPQLKSGPKTQQQQQGQQGQQGQQQQSGDSFGDLRQSQQALRDRLNKLLEDLKNRGFAPNQQGKPGQGQQQGQGQGDTDDLDRAGEAMSEA